MYAIFLHVGWIWYFCFLSILAVSLSDHFVCRGWSLYDFIYIHQLFCYCMGVDYLIFFHLISQQSFEWPVTGNLSSSAVLSYFYTTESTAIEEFTQFTCNFLIKHSGVLSWVNRHSTSAKKGEEFLKRKGPLLAQCCFHRSTVKSVLIC